MFSEATSFNQPIGNWSTEKVTDMRAMFNEAEAFNQPIGNWNTAAVTNMRLMFSGVQSFNQPISNWNTEKVTDMTAMFQGTSSFNQPIGNWNTAAVTNMSFMFNFAIAFNQPIGNWNTEKVTNMRQMFHFALIFNQSLGTWRLNVVDDLLFMLTNCGMDCTNYSATLIGWNNNPATPNGRSLGANGRTYGTNAEAARTNLIDVKGWTITGDALAPVTTAEAGSNEAICSLTTTLAGNTPVIGTGTWTQVSGPGTANFADANAPNTGVTASVPGTYTLRWTMNAPCAASSDDVAITFAANPTANAGDNQTSNATCGLTQVTLAGNTPSVVTGEWSIQSGTGGSFGDASSPTSTFSGAAGNTYTLRWTVTNAPCAASTDEMTVTFNQSPSFATCPPGVTVSFTSGCSATATYTAAAANATPSASVTYAFGGATTGSGSGTGSGQTFNLGTTTVNLTATNSCGNSNCSFTVTVIDNQNPSITCPGDISKSTDANQCTAVVTYPNPVFSDNCAGGYLTRTSGPASGSVFPKGTTMVNWVATDASGNSSLCGFTVTVNDAQAPSITCPVNLVKSTDIGQCTAVVTYATPVFTDNCTGVTGVLFSGGASGSAFPKGANSVVWQATDGEGLTKRCTFTITVNDMQTPTIACPGNQTKSTDTGLCTAVITYTTPTFTDNCTGGSVAIQNGLASGSAFPKGINTVTWRATDEVGLTKTCAFKITVNDTENPVITCPANQSRNADAGLCTAATTYPTPTATDNCMPAPALVRVSGPLSGSAFPAGVTTCVWRAIDGANRSSTCSFTVTVTDTQLPGITCPPNQSVTAAPGQCSATIYYSNPTATDNCGVNSVFLLSGSPSGSLFAQGSTVNTWRAVDVNGLNQTCSFSVTVACGTGAQGGEAANRAVQGFTTFEKSPGLDLRLSPNPAVSEVQIWIENLGDAGGQLTVLDARGRMVWQTSSVANGQLQTADVSDFAAGLYFVTLSSEGQTVTKRLVVSRL